MPGYLYECKPCERTITVFRSVTAEENVPECVECAKPMQRSFGLSAVAFKGPGFYSTDKRR